jgi:hypothetical protein
MSALDSLIPNDIILDLASILTIQLPDGRG